ncbi:hypothetical protein EVA_20754, partial [gut metagenome]
PDTLTLKLEPNENFQILEKYKSSNQWGNSSATDIDGARFTFIIDEITKCPPRWNGGGIHANRYFGEWTPEKYNYINGLFGFTQDDWEWETGKISAGRMSFYAMELQKELQRRADEGDPVYDADGGYMQLPAPYDVDYSNVQPKK